MKIRPNQKKANKKLLHWLYNINTFKMKSIRPYFIVFSTWIAVLVMYYLSATVQQEISGSYSFRLISKFIILSVSIVLLFMIVKSPKKLLNQKSPIKITHILFLLILAGAFAGANFWEAAHDIFDFTDYKSQPVISLLAITISSIHEELFYRGTVQTYINDQKEEVFF